MGEQENFVGVALIVFEDQNNKMCRNPNTVETVMNNAQRQRATAQGIRQ